MLQQVCCVTLSLKSICTSVNESWLHVTQDEADDFVIATGETRSVRDFCVEAFAIAGMPLRWQGSGVEVN